MHPCSRHGYSRGFSQKRSGSKDILDTVHYLVSVGIPASVCETRSVTYLKREYLDTQVGDPLAAS